MAAASARAPQPNRRKGRTATVQPLQNCHNININGDSKAVLRLQRLWVIGVVGTRADLIVSMAWEAGA